MAEDQLDMLCVTHQLSVEYGLEVDLAVKGRRE